MGIRVVCPNGHQLNVKAFLAGKKGICPHCQSRFNIPVEQPTSSTLTNPNQATRSDSQKVVDESTVVTREPTSQTPDPDAATPASFVATPAATPPPTTIPGTIPLAQPVAPAAEPALWYVRPPAGGQYGPATEEMMQQWIADGRVPDDALVWRNGWADWAKAGTVADRLPRLARQVPFASGSADGPESVAIGTVGESATSNAATPAQTAAGRLRRKRKAAAKVQAWTAGLLLVAAIILGVLLVFVLSSNDNEATPNNETPTENNPE